MTLNTPENRAAFVKEFGPEPHPNGPWCVDDNCAGLILGALDRDPDRYWVPLNLRAFIMQRRDTFMVIEGEIQRHSAPVGRERYDRICFRIIGLLYDWLKELPEYKDVPPPGVGKASPKL